MKFSIVIPVYNVERFLEKCLESVISQTYKNYEVIVVNDGTKDNSQSIIDNYVKKYPEYIKGYIKENGGLSDARNFGIEKCTGDYIVFLDSDDFIEKDLLKRLNDLIIAEGIQDVIGYHTEIFDKDYKFIEILKKPIFKNLSGEEALIKLIQQAKLFETAWGYCYNLKYWKKNNFKYAKGLLHEDLGLTPEVIIKANNVSILDYNGYAYYQSENSIMRGETVNLEKEYQKTLDLIEHFDRLKGILECDQYSKDAKNELYNYLISSIMWKFRILDNSQKQNLVKMIRERKLQKYKINKTIREKKDFLVLRLKYRF